MILLIDNYDSFVFNLARYVQELGVSVRVARNDAINMADVAQLQPQAVMISPGPCTPNEAGISVELVKSASSSLPILGVCLGHQAIATAFGGEVIRDTHPVHGRDSMIEHDGSELFASIANPFNAARYHSLVVNRATLPECLRVTAQLANGTIMGLAHRERPVYGVQFHPESVLTPSGHRLLFNFLSMAGMSPILPPEPGGELLDTEAIDPDSVAKTTAFW